jgi:hypothetical protein
MNNRQRFDDERGIVWFVKYQDEMTTVTIYVTSWWRQLLWQIGINVYYRKEEIRLPGDPYNLLSRKYPLTSNECIETKPESNE